MWSIKKCFFFGYLINLNDHFIIMTLKKLKKFDSLLSKSMIY